MLFTCPATDDFFRSRIDHMIDLCHPLAVLAWRMPWQEIEARVVLVFSRKGRAGVAMPVSSSACAAPSSASAPSSDGYSASSSARPAPSGRPQ